MDDYNSVNELLILPRLRVQNANVISSPLTWGFPSITAFMGLMWNLQRRIASAGMTNLIFKQVGVICHGFEAQVDATGHVTRFNLTRNPLGKDGKPPAFAEEGRAHLDITLVFAISRVALYLSGEERAALARRVEKVVEPMRIAGGTVNIPRNRRRTPDLICLDDDDDRRAKQFRHLARSWLPGFTLVQRTDLLRDRHVKLQETGVPISLLDAWLDLSRLEWQACKLKKGVPVGGNGDDESSSDYDSVEWRPTRQADGWIVPIPVGYSAISDVFRPGTVANARDNTTPFRFVESVYSIGQWISPHRLDGVEQLLWYPVRESIHSGIYQCANSYAVSTR